ncbi:hypothetical protein [Priestia megaterium]|uniref:hypothetical protein n=1 Tax=Priestia megaterium TaxID=1404 RepID=UPI002FFFB6AE
MTEKKVDITEPYNMELQEIANKLRQLEQGRVIGLVGSNMDGTISTNIVQLRKMISDLILKVEYGKDSALDEMSEIF